MQEENLGLFLRKQFRRAQVLARWSYVGIIFPILGVIFGAMSRSMISDLPKPKKQPLVDKYRHVNNLALGGIVISGILLSISVLAVSFFLIISEPDTKQNTEVTASSNTQNEYLNSEQVELVEMRIRLAYVMGCIDAAKTALEQQGVYVASYQLDPACSEEADSKGEQLKYHQ